MSKIPTHFSTLLMLLLIAFYTNGQEPHYAGVQFMNIWYNPSLKIDKIVQARFSFRSVKYPNIISYTSKTLSIEIPLVSKDKSDYDNSYFFNVGAGICADNSNNKFFNASTAMLAASYALPLTPNDTYLAVGIQGNYSFNRVGNGYNYSFPEQFDKTGALNAAMTKDPFESGYNYEYFTAGAGVSIFHNTQQEQWYIGGSIRNFNHPYTEWNHSARLPSNFGIQGAYTFSISNSAELFGYGNFTWQSNINEHLVGSRYIRHFSDSSNYAFSLGCGFRIGNALIPEAGIQIGKGKLLFYYELNVSKFPSANYHRRAYEFSYTHNL